MLMIPTKLKKINRMNIVYLGKYTLNNFHASAGSKRVLNQIKYLEKHNNIKVITLSKYKSHYNYNINLKRFDNRLFQLLILPLYWLLTCTMLICNRRKGQNVILLESVVELNFLAPVLFSKLLGYKLVHDVVENFLIPLNDTSKSQLGNSLITRQFYKFTASYVNGIIVISERLLKLYSKFNKPIIKIYNSVEINNIESEYSTENKDFTFLYSGTFGTKDGVKDLILAFNNISNYYFNVKLVLTGKNNSKYFHECMELIKSNTRIYYLGYLSDVNLHNEYQNADVLMITRDNSLFADFGFPYKLSEYLTYKKPIICSAVSDIPALFIDYVDILLTEPSNVESIIEKMKFSIERKSELKKLSENGFNKVNDYFSISKNGEMIHNFLLNI